MGLCTAITLAPGNSELVSSETLPLIPDVVTCDIAIVQVKNKIKKKFEFFILCVLLVNS